MTSWSLARSLSPASPATQASEGLSPPPAPSGQEQGQWSGDRGQPRPAAGLGVGGQQGTDTHFLTRSHLRRSGVTKGTHGHPAGSLQERTGRCENLHGNTGTCEAGVTLKQSAVPEYTTGREGNAKPRGPRRSPGGRRASSSALTRCPPGQATLWGGTPVLRTTGHSAAPLAVSH